MEKFTGENFQWLLITLTSVLLVACNTRQAIPFAEGDTSFAQPVTRQLHFSALKKLTG